METSDENSNKTSFQSHLDVSDENTNKTSFQSHLDVSDENTNKTNINQHMKITKKVNSKTSRLASLIPTVPPASLRIPTPAKDKQPIKKQIKKQTITPNQVYQSESLVQNNQLLSIVNSQLDQLLSDFDE